MQSARIFQIVERLGMRATPIVVLLAICCAVEAASHQASRSEQTPEGVARQVSERDTGADGRLEMVMRLIDRQGRARERTLVMTSLRGAGDRGDRFLVRFDSPGDIKGTGLLVWEHRNGEDERFLYLPALGRVRRIAGSEKQESFVGSDFSYEEIGGRELPDYTYAFAQPEVNWTAPDGQTHPAWQLEYTSKDSAMTYPRAVATVRKDNFVVVAADIFNRRKARVKQYEVRRLDRIDGVWTVMDAVMANDIEKTRTELSVRTARYNVGLTEADFSRRALEQGTR